MHQSVPPTELVIEPTGPRRLVHSFAYRTPGSFANRVLAVGLEVAIARLADMAIARRLRISQIRREEPGDAPAATGGRRVALYLHYSPSGYVSPMVCAQLAGYRALGFDVVFATNAERFNEASWRAVAPHCWRLIWRNNLGLDFGAWRDSAALLLDGQQPPEELLLVNDSVLGPIRPLAPLLRRARALGAGAVGLTESHQGGVHLQSYFVLVLGTAAVADTIEFLLGLQLSTAKWLMVQRGEFGLTRFLAKRGHRVAALFGYAQALDAVLACSEERRYLANLVPRWAPGDTANPTGIRDALLRWPVNPTSHLWRALPRCLGFPFIKVAVVHRNFGRLPGVAAWPALLESGSPAFELALEHLARLEPHG